MPASDGGAAIKKRMTMRGGDTVKPETEAKLLGLNEEVNEIQVEKAEAKPAAGGGGAKNSLKRKETLTKVKSEQKEVVGISKDGTAVTETKENRETVQTVGKEGSACCSIF